MIPSPPPAHSCPKHTHTHTRTHTDSQKLGKCKDSKVQFGAGERRTMFFNDIDQYNSASFRGRRNGGHRNVPTREGMFFNDVDRSMESMMARQRFPITCRRSAAAIAAYEIRTDSRNVGDRWDHLGVRQKKLLKNIQQRLRKKTPSNSSTTTTTKETRWKSLQWDNSM